MQPKPAQNGTQPAPAQNSGELLLAALRRMKQREAILERAKRLLNRPGQTGGA